MSSFNFHFEDELHITDAETQTLPEDISEIFANDNDDTDYGDMVQLDREDYDEVMFVFENHGYVMFGRKTGRT